MPSSGIYVASKHAVAGLTKTAAREGGCRNVRVNAIAPGVINTSMLDGIAEARGSEAVTFTVQRFQALNRKAEPSEMSEVMAFLLSDQASFVTGAVWEADGGWST